MSSTLRAWCAALLLIVGVVVLAPVAPATAAGPYAVGKRTYTFVDTTRPTSPNGTYAGAPDAHPADAPALPGAGRPAGPAVENAPALATSGRRFPLVVFSHGFGASGPAYQWLLERLVRAGTPSPRRRSRSPAAARPADRGSRTTSTSPVT